MRKARLPSTHCHVKLLCGLAAHGANQKVLASLDLHGEVGKAVVTERVEIRAVSWVECSDPGRLDRSAPARES